MQSLICVDNSLPYIPRVVLGYSVSTTKVHRELIGH